MQADPRTSAPPGLCRPACERLVQYRTVLHYESDIWKLAIDRAAFRFSCIVHCSRQGHLCVPLHAANSAVLL